MRYKLVIFDMDDTLLAERTIYALADKKGFREELEEIINKKTWNYKKTIQIAKLLKGMKLSEFLHIIRSIPLSPHVEEVLNTLRKKGVKTAIVTNSYDIAAEDLRKRLKMDYAVGNHLIIDNGVITGEIELHNKNPIDETGNCLSYSVCKRDVLYDLCTKLGISTKEVIAVGDGKIDLPMLEAAGLGVAYNALPDVQQRADIAIQDMKELLHYI